MAAAANFASEIRRAARQELGLVVSVVGGMCMQGMACNCTSGAHLALAALMAPHPACTAIGSPVSHTVPPPAVEMFLSRQTRCCFCLQLLVVDTVQLLHLLFTVAPGPIPDPGPGP